MNTEKNLADAILADKKSDRFWRNFRFFVWIFLTIVILILIFAPRGENAERTVMAGKPYVSLIRLNGIILPGSEFSADKVIPLLIKAFSDKKAKGVVLVINSPGGSAVQASIIHDKIEQLKKLHNKKVVVVGTDALASGAYLIATAADKIYVNPDTLTGSIGVILASFGFVDTIKKLGITRRVFTAGANKDRLDPFKPMTPGDKIKIQNVLSAAHQNFIDDVLAGRKNKLKGNRKELFSGDFWIGQKAVTLGLADGTANVWTVLKDEFSVTHYKDYSRKPTLLESLLKGVDTELHLGLTNRSSGIEAILPGK